MYEVPELSGEVMEPSLSTLTRMSTKRLSRDVRTMVDVGSLAESGSQRINLRYDTVPMILKIN